MSLPNIRPTITVKVGGIAALLLVGLVIVGAYSFVQIRSVGQEINVVVTSDLVIRDQVAAIERGVNLRRDLNIEMVDLFNQNRTTLVEDHFEESKQEATNTSAQIREVFGIISKDDSNDEVPTVRYVQLFDMFRDLQRRDDEFSEDTVSYVTALLGGDNVQAAQILTRLLNQGSELEILLVSISDEVQNLSQESGSSAQDRQRFAATATVIVAISAILVGGGLAAFLTRRLTASVHTVALRAREIEQTVGTDDFEHKEIPSVSSDEVGDLAVAFNEMSSNLARNIEVRRQYEQELAGARDDALQANQAKSNFLANMSHELRTPLNAIIGYSEMLEEEAEDLEQESLVPDLKKINLAGRHLLTLISGVLDLSKIEAGQLDVYVEEFDLGVMIAEILTVITPLVEKNANKLESAIDPNIGMMRADSTKVRQIIFNLLSNAAKFTENGLVRLEAEVYTEHGEKCLRARVIDSGIGMTPEQVGHVFEEFTQADSSISRRFEGTGLGLTISKQYANLMGGDITVDSAEGEGSKFTIVMPMDTEKYVPEDMLSVI